MTALDLRVRQGFVASGVPSVLIDEILNTFAEAKRRFYRADLRPSAIEGGRFSEAVFRVLQWRTTHAYVALGKTLPPVDRMLVTMEQAQGAESVRTFTFPARCG